MEKRRVLITGAGSGLGRALAFRYAEAGCRVACADIRLDRAEETVRLITAFGIGAMALEVDVASDASVEALRDEVLAAWDGVDVVINNAGVASAGGLVDTPLDDWRWTLDINLMSVVRGCRAFLPILIEQGLGQIVNTASFAGIANPPGLAAYAVSKAGVIALSESLRGELALARTAVRVSVVCPSFFPTNLMEGSRGPPSTRHVAEKLMAKSKESADDIAAYIYDAAERGDFLILPTSGDIMRARIKRWFPNVFLRKLLEAYRDRTERA
jgi:NAD(P)-dependent dehydrogenase (short-subunit alcohol dehydrogenase family)